MADLDGDGRTDAIGTTTFSVWIGLGTAGGGFLATPDCYFHYSPIDAAVGTFDDDGTVDVAFTNAFDQLHLFLGDGAGGFVDRD
ncbi:MAG: hypothetical protein IPK07_29790 [Deltaproteobacteria bacterium]|nr:hypothetical protein [Deltaproteobacteria bacterium]